MSRNKTPRHFIYNEYDIMKETQEPDKSAFDELSLNREFQVPEGLEMDGAFICKFMRVTRDMTCIVTRKIQF